MKILAIESSCDETAVAILEGVQSNGQHKLKVLANVVSSQIEIHRQYGGVVPEIAARSHAENFMHVFDLALKNANLQKEDIDSFAVTYGPGLITSLMVGIAAAKTLSYVLDKPLVPVDHMKGHIYANCIERDLDYAKIFPCLALVVSGGHTELVFMRTFEQFEKIGQTLDDAAGEAFDKIAKMLELGYPGGPVISQYAEKGDPEKYNFPRPLLKHKNFDFSFAGLKTSVLYFLRDHKKSGQKFTKKFKQDVCASVQAAIVECLVVKTIKAAKQYTVKSVILAGGVSANKELRLQLEKAVAEQLMNVAFLRPEFVYCTDNAVMIAAAAYFRYTYSKEKRMFQHTWKGLQPEPSLDIL